MSYYYTYYLGYEKDGLLYPLGPYDCNGKLCSVLTRSRSFASDLHNLFDPVRDSIASDEFKKVFEHEDYRGEKGYEGVSYLPAADLPYGDLFMRGYCLVKDILYYLDPVSDGDTNLLSYHMLTPEQFSFKAKAEMEHGVKPSSESVEREDEDSDEDEDEYGYDEKDHPCSDYAYFSFVDNSSRNFEAYMIRSALEMFEYSDVFLGSGYKKTGAKPVVILSEG